MTNDRPHANQPPSAPTLGGSFSEGRSINASGQITSTPTGPTTYQSVVDLD